MMDTGKFVQSTVGIVIATIVAVSVGIPLISGLMLESSSTFANKEIVNTMLGVIPIFLIIAILLSSVAIMKIKKSD